MTMLWRAVWTAALVALYSPAALAAFGGGSGVAVGLESLIQYSLVIMGAVVGAVVIWWGVKLLGGDARDGFRAIAISAIGVLIIFNYGEIVAALGGR